MAMVSKGGPGGQDGLDGQGATGGGNADEGPVRMNLPPRVNPIVGRRSEFQAVAAAFEKARERNQVARVEITGRPGVGASWTALELAWRNGARYPGGAWYVHLGMGEDVAWADVAATRGRRLSKDLRRDAEELKLFLHGGPKALVVIDGAESRDVLERNLSEDLASGPDVILVTESPSGLTDLVVEVADVPERAPRRIAAGYLFQRDGEGAVAPPVRSTDGLAITASLAARLAVRHEGRQGPIDVARLEAGVMAMVPWIQRNGLALEALLMCSVAHPVRIPMDALFDALTALRSAHGEPPKPEEVVQAMQELIGHGMISVDDPSRVSMHPLLQGVVRGFLKGEADLRLARETLAKGLVSQAREAIHEEGLDVLRAGLHQLRFLQPSLQGAAAAEVSETLAACEAAAGLSNGDAAA